ncbi:hypothetical protein AGLY_000650, partial [Aphis glycines]
AFSAIESDIPTNNFYNLKKFDKVQNTNIKYSNVQFWVKIVLVDKCRSNTVTQKPLVDNTITILSVQIKVEIIGQFTVKELSLIIGLPLFVFSMFSTIFKLSKTSGVYDQSSSSLVVLNSILMVFPGNVSILNSNQTCVLTACGVGHELNMTTAIPGREKNIRNRNFTGLGENRREENNTIRTKWTVEIPLGVIGL